MPIIRKSSTAVIAPLGLLIVILILTWFLYATALPGYFLFDDGSSLAGLSQVQDWRSALAFVLSGHAGPLGRPLTLATFLAQLGAWPNDPGAMLAVNIAIHLAAMVACFVLAAGLARVRLPIRNTTDLWIGLGVAALWGLSPLLATTHLMIIQRMTSVAGFFVLSGLAAFVWAHLLADSRPRLARVLLVAGLGIGTLLGALAKENGALLPLLALVILWLWIPKDRRLTGRVNQLLIAALAIVPSVLVLAYLGDILLKTIAHGYGPHRYFTLEERLMSQPAILLDYLRNLLLPRASQVSPFMDWLPAPKGWFDPQITAIAAVFWVGLTLGAFIWRRAAPYLWFGLLFFFTGHLLESGFIGLELYYAHRNYVPSVGLYFALVFAVASTPLRYRRAAIAGLGVYALMFVLVLYQFTSVWSEPQRAAQTWLERNPHSERAAQWLAGFYLKQGNPLAARSILDAAVARNPRLTVLQLRRATLCAGLEDRFPALLQQLTAQLPTAFYQSFAAEELARIARGYPAPFCSKLDPAALTALADGLLANPRYTRKPAVKANLLLAKAYAAAAAGQKDDSVALALESYRTSQDLDGAFFAVSFMVRFGQDARADAFLREVRSSAPADALNKAVWVQRLDEFISGDLVGLRRQRDQSSAN